MHTRTHTPTKSPRIHKNSADTGKHISPFARNHTNSLEKQGAGKAYRKSRRSCNFLTQQRRARLPRPTVPCCLGHPPLPPPDMMQVNVMALRGCGERERERNRKEETERAVVLPTPRARERKPPPPLIHHKAPHPAPRRRQGTHLPPPQQRTGLACAFLHVVGASAPLALLNVFSKRNSRSKSFCANRPLSTCLRSIRSCGQTYGHT